MDLLIIFPLNPQHHHQALFTATILVNLAGQFFLSFKHRVVQTSSSSPFSASSRHPSLHPLEFRFLPLALGLSVSRPHSSSLPFSSLTILTPSRTSSAASPSRPPPITSAFNPCHRVQALHTPPSTQNRPTSSLLTIPPPTTPKTTTTSPPPYPFFRWRSDQPFPSSPPLLPHTHHLFDFCAAFRSARLCEFRGSSGAVQ
ncbi:hypothetical protein HDK64DRAFT_259169 [Phyllosticta capitalensis]